MKNIILSAFLSFTVLLGCLTFTINQAVASIICPPGYHCALLFEVVTGNADCPDGYTCTPDPFAPGCPPEHVCFTKELNAVSTTNTSKNPSTASTTMPIISSLDHYSSPAGSIITVVGKNFGTAPSISLSSATILPTFIIPTSSVKDQSGNYKTVFMLPISTSAGTYTIAVKTSAGLVSNPITFIVTSLTSSAQTQTSTQTSTQNTSTNTNTNNSNTTTNSNTNTNTNTTNNSNTSTNRSGRFSLNDFVQTTDSLRVRSAPSIYGSIVTTVALGSRGTIKGGPTTADGYIWWRIQYSSGISGWSADTYLATDVTDNGTGACFTFANDLTVGSELDDMFYLQTALTAEGFSISSSEKDPPYFGNSTLSAAIGFQRKYGIFPQVGYVGPLTRSRLNIIYGCRQ